MNNTQRITLDILDNQTYEQIYIKQYNKGFLIEFEITRDGLPFDFSNAIAVFEMKKPDKTIYVDYCNISDNVLSIEVTDQMTVVEGRAKFQITLYDLDSYNYDTKTGDVVITTVTGIIKIDKSTVQEGDIQSEDTFNLVADVISETKAYVSEAKEHATNASTSATTASEQVNIAQNYAVLSESYAVGGTGTRDGEDTDNAKYYSEQAGELITTIRDEVDETLKTALVTKADLDSFGMVKLEQIPKTALDNLVKVANDTTRFALTSEEVQTGDTVLVLESDDGSERMYLVVDDTQLDNENGYTIYTASVTWDTIIGKPSGIEYISGVTSNIQTQLDSKASNTGWTASRVICSNSSGKLTPCNTTTTEIDYLSGVTSAIQTQLNDKQPKLSGSISTILNANLTASRVLITNSSGYIAASSSIGTDELGYLDGVTSNIQTQLDAKAPKSHASTGTTYGVGTTSNYGHCMTINNLTTSSHANGKALSAYQGKVLNDKITTLNQAVNTSIATGAKAIMSYTDSNYYQVNNLMTFTDSANALCNGDKGLYIWAISSFSDERLKTNINDCQLYALDKINQVQLREFDFIDEKYGTHKDIGYIAQELIEVFPEAVVLLPQDKETTGYDSLYQVEDKHIIPYLVKAIQELSTKVNILEAKNEELEKQIAS